MFPLVATTGRPATTERYSCGSKWPVTVKAMLVSSRQYILASSAVNTSCSKTGRPAPDADATPFGSSLCFELLLRELLGTLCHLCPLRLGSLRGRLGRGPAFGGATVPIPPLKSEHLPTRRKPPQMTVASAWCGGRRMATWAGGPLGAAGSSQTSIHDTNADQQMDCGMQHTCTRACAS